jgi:hypothetical protein
MKMPTLNYTQAWAIGIGIAILMAIVYFTSSVKADTCSAENIGAKFIVQGAPPLVSLPAFLGLVVMSPVVLAIEDKTDRKAKLFRCHVAVFGKASMGSKRDTH